MMKKNGEDASELLAQAAAIPGELKALEDELEEIREKLTRSDAACAESAFSHHADRQG